MTDALDLEVALRTIHQLGLEDGDIGYSYWHQVAQLLESAAAMRVQLENFGQSDLDGSGIGLVSPRRLEHYKALDAQTTRAEPSGGSATSPLEELRENAVANEARELCISADYYVLDSTVSPRQALERFRIECDLPVGDEKFDVDIRVADDQSHETYLAVWRDFSWGSMTLSEVILRCFLYARFGTQECPSVECYPDAFDEVVLAIQERTASIFSEPLLLLSACSRHGLWTLNWLKAYMEEGGQAWTPKAADGPLNPLQLLWDAALVVDGQTGNPT